MQTNTHKQNTESKMHYNEIRVVTLYFQTTGRE